MSVLELRTASKLIPIRIECGGMEWLAREIESCFAPQRPRFLLVCDERVALLYGKSLHTYLESCGLSVEFMSLPPGESEKNFRTLKLILDKLAHKNFSRKDVLLALGGGVITDINGFAASIYARGIRWIALPTTVLGMVDASIGGKTAINHETAKNLIGAFHQPECVLADILTLKTLVPRETRSGAAEIVKGALLEGGAIWMELQDEGPDALTWSEAQLFAMIEKGARAKIEIVSRDEFESGERMLLNLGHTFGHALENVAGYGTLTHGEAVFYGMQAAVWLSEKMGLMKKEIAVALLLWMQTLSLPRANVTAESLLQALPSDKKADQGKLRWILLSKPGVPEIRDDVPLELVQECAAWLCDRVRGGEEVSVREHSAKRILILHGPNLNLLGTREPEIYGSQTLSDIESLCETHAQKCGAECLFRSSNHEGELIEYIQWARHWADGIIVNPGAYTHTSVALRDALSAIKLPTIELHLSDPSQREEYRHHSFIRDVCLRTVSGHGADGYAIALDFLLSHLSGTLGQSAG
ncbi:3-dehydroquinate synthase [bacterium]|nr:3-dehydroquinate synthase [bacterium]